MDKIVILEEFRREWTSEQLEEVIKCWDKGCSYKDIAHRFDINETESIMVLLHLDVYEKLTEREGGIFGSVDNDNTQIDIGVQMNKKDIRLKICELLDVCRGCEFNRTLHRRNKVNEVCKQCHVYQDISKLGKQILDSKK